MPVFDREELKQTIKELGSTPCLITIANTSLFWFFVGRALSDSLSEDAWMLEEEELIKRLLSQIECAFKEIAPDAAKLMRENEDTE